MNGKTTTEGHYRTYTSQNNSRIAQDNVTTRDYHLEAGLQDSGSVLIQLHNQLHQFTICTFSYTINYISLQHVHSVTQSITQT